MWTYDLTYHLMRELEIIIVVAIMTYIVETNLDDLHLMDECVFNDFNNIKYICLAKSILILFSA